MKIFPPQEHRTCINRNAPRSVMSTLLPPPGQFFFLWYHDDVTFLASTVELIFNKTIRRLLNNLYSCAAAQKGGKGIAAGQLGTSTVTCRRGITNTLPVRQTALQVNSGVNTRSSAKTTALCTCLFSSRNARHRYGQPGPPSRRTVPFWANDTHN